MRVFSLILYSALATAINVTLIMLLFNNNNNNNKSRPLADPVMRPDSLLRLWRL